MVEYKNIIIENPQCNTVVMSVCIFFQVQTLFTKFVINYMVSYIMLHQPDIIFQNNNWYLGIKIKFSMSKDYVLVGVS